ncbi:MAG TPA: tetratricopeptide repeat protein [Acidobacteriaceae bacterium]
MIAPPCFLKIAYVSLLGIVFTLPSYAQTYTVGPSTSAQPQKKSTQKTGSKAQAPKQPLGWGSNIQNARLANAALEALKQGNHALAVEYAQKAAQSAPDDAHLWFLLGYAARLDRNYQLSLSAYNHGLRLTPSSVEGLSGLAQTYSLMGRIDDAEHLLQQVIASNPQRRNDVLLMGNLYMRSGDYTGALTFLHRAERMKPEARSEVLLAISYEHLKQMDQANHYLELAKRRDPNNPDVQRSLAGYYRQVGNYPAAIAALKSIHNPRPDVKAELAFTYQLDGKLPEAAKEYAEVANQLPKNLGYQLSAAQATVAAGSIDNADPFLQRAAGINPNSYRLHAVRGEIAQLQNHLEDAVREYAAAIEHLPANPAEGPLYGIQLHVDLMQLYRNLGDDTGMQQQLKIAQTQIGALDERGADRSPFLRLRALIKMNAGQLDSALKDINEALSISPHDPNNLQLDGDLLVKLGRTEEAIAVYKKILTVDSRNRFALTSLGYASRVVGHEAEAKAYFERLAKDYPTLYIPYLALGDMYTANHEYAKAEASYRKAFSLAPKNALIIASGMNAAIEAQKLDLAGKWLERASNEMKQQPQVLKQRERYLRLQGHYQESVDVGQEAIKALPKDRDVVVYLGYDYLQLQQYSQLAKLTSDYYNIFPQDSDIPLLAGYVEKHNNDDDKALQDFSEAIRRNPKVATAYVNRGYIYNDLHKPDLGAADFETAIKLEPNNGQAHMGLAYSDLDLGKSKAAIHESELAEKQMGDSEFVHVIRATAYGRQGMLTKAISEYHAALKFAPNDGGLHLGLGNALFAEKRYHDAVNELLIAQKLIPDNAVVYGLLARAYAEQQDREHTMEYVQLAEQHALQTPNKANPAELSEIYVTTGEALNTIGDQKGAMERFSKALSTPHSDRVAVRLAIAHVMAQENHTEDAERQIALAFMEAEAGRTAPASGTEYIQAADIFRQMHEYDLSITYLGKARNAGAPDIMVRTGMANTYLAVGDVNRAAAELAAVSSEDSNSDYQYLLAQAQIYKQQHQGVQALTAFAQAASAAGEDQTAQQSLLAAGASEGYMLNSKLSVLGNFSLQPTFEDTTIYVLDSKLDQPIPVPPTDIALLPPLRSSLVTQGMGIYHLHFGNFIPTSGFFQIRNSQGTISVPATSSIVNRNTTDYTANFGVNPSIRLGRNAITLDTGVQGTIRRDSESPSQMDQNLFRAFLYGSTTSFYDVVSAAGYVIYEGGPFTERDIHSRALAASLNFRVGRPWGQNALIAGWGANDQQFSPVGIEDYFTSSYVGFSRHFSNRWSAQAVVEDVRAWRIVTPRSGIAQAVRYAGTIDYNPTPSWDVQASLAYENTRTYHAYDATQNGFSVSYVKALHHKISDATGDVEAQYPLHFSAGFEQESFFNFTPGKNQQFRPYVSISIF